MKKVIAYGFGIIGFLMQAGAIFGLPIYVFFLGGSAWWLLAFAPLGIAGMVPIHIMKSLIGNEDS